MKKSSFQFNDPMLMKFEYNVNKKLKPTDINKKVENVEFNVSIHRNPNDETQAVVELNIEIGDENTPFYINVIEGAVFKWDKGEYSESEISSLLKANAPAVLLSYVRPLIASVSSMSPLGTYKLPLINFAESTKTNR